MKTIMHARWIVLTIITTCYLSIRAIPPLGVVGINTNNPKANLEINGDLMIDSIKEVSNPTRVLVPTNDSNKIGYLPISKLLRNTDVISWPTYTIGLISDRPLYSYFSDNDSIIVMSTPNYSYAPTLYVATSGQSLQKRDLFLDLPGGSYLNFKSAVNMNGYIYILARNESTGTDKVLRYNQNNINGGTTVINFTGSKVLVSQPAGSSQYSTMTTDGTYFYINYNAGNLNADSVIAKYSLSCTTLNYISSITCNSGYENLTSYLVHPTIGIISTSIYDHKLRKFSLIGGNPLLIEGTKFLFLFNLNNVYSYGSEYLTNWSYQKFYIP